MTIDRDEHVMVVPISHLIEILRKAIIKKKCSLNATNVGDEGGFAPNIQENKVLQLIRTTIAKAGYTATVPSHVVIGINVAASEFYRSDKTYDLKLSRQWMQATVVINVNC
ncbi:Hypothetical predicted protein [Olea europaea subsp. europaea]|uniref:phosphopyruvate hydratase n=1 Tax=Olea europaea subsp. europaea TaxID=158383 RepID=A0A8S0SUX5_OLEEU|nr:Hypothetical predicted protein [Olea europaea subsp. europaea]